MNVLITGVTGFVGKYITSILPTYFSKSDLKIFGTFFNEDCSEFNLENIKLLHLDITNKKEVYEVIEEVMPDYIFHLAAQSSVSESWKNPQLTFSVNVNGTINILEAIKDIKKDSRVLIVGSSEQYGKVPEMPIDEEYRQEPQNPYAVSKCAQEQVARLYSKGHNLQVIATRSFNHIGPMQLPIFVVSDWAKQIAEIEKGIKEPVMKVGDITVERDFTDVRDVVRAYMDLVTKGTSGEVYNVGSGNAHRLDEILKILLSYSTAEITVETDKSKIRPIENKVIKCNRNKISESCSWVPEYSVEKTLLDVLNYWRKVIEGK